MNQFNTSETDTAAALDAGMALAAAEQKPRQLSETGTPFLVNTQGEAKSLEKFLPAPLRHTGVLALDDVASFVEYLNLYKQAGTLVFSKCDLSGGKFTAKLDYPEPGKTSWGGHVATLALVPTPDWLAWMGVHGRWQTQQQFCEFVEKQRHVFSDPKAADMLEISRNIEARQEGNFKGGIRLPNGDRTLLWESTTTASAGVNKIEIPEEITIAIMPFEGADIVLVSAFLRYRIEGGAVKFQVEFQRPEEIIRASVKAARDNIASATGLPVLAGTVA